MKPNTLTIASLLSIILLPFHVGGDVALGLDRGGSGLVFIVVPILLVVACGTLLLAERRSGHVIMFLGGLAALGMPIIHRNNGFTAAVAKSPGGLFFIWTLVALGVTGGPRHDTLGTRTVEPAFAENLMLGSYGVPPQTRPASRGFLGGKMLCFAFCFQPGRASLRPKPNACGNASLRLIFR